MDLIDIGANLGHASFRRDLDDVVRRAGAAGVHRMVVTGTSLVKSREAVALARARSLFATAGIHPHDARTCDEATIPALRELAADPAVRAIGECGLDFDRDFSPRPAQETWFERQLELAADLGLPVFLHERAAHDRFAAILQAHRSRLAAGAVIHCFTGSASELDAYLALDLHIGITGWICDERRGAHLAALLPRIPADRLMIETDAPFLLPRDLRPRPEGRRNEPAFLVHVLAAVARATGRAAEAVAAETTATAERFFALARR